MFLAASRISARRAPVPVLVAGLLLLGACQDLPQHKGETVTVVQIDSETQPIDVIVAPVRNETGRTDIDVDDLRARFQKGLVVLRYSPLALEYVDRNYVEASVSPSSLGVEGILEVVISRWDESLLVRQGTFGVTAEARLRDASDPDPDKALWHGVIDRDYDLSAEVATRSLPLLRKRAHTKLAEEILAAIPPRDPRVPNP